jgi:hypothetical protein
MKHRVRIVAALVAGLLLLAVPMAAAQSPSAPTTAKKYGICLSLNPDLTICY